MCSFGLFYHVIFFVSDVLFPLHFCNCKIRDEEDVDIFENVMQLPTSVNYVALNVIVSYGPYELVLLVQLC